MFQEFVDERIEGDGATLFVRRAGPQGAPPLVLLHGYPQTSAMWHGVAPILARSYQWSARICADMVDQTTSVKCIASALFKRVMAMTSSQSCSVGT